MRLDRQIVASVFATAIGFWLFPLIFGAWTPFAFGGALLGNFLVAIIAWIFANIAFMGGGGRKR